MALELNITKYYAYDPTIDRSFWIGAVSGGVRVDMFRGANGEQVAGAILDYDKYEEFRQAVPNARLPVFRAPDPEADAPPGNTIGHVVGPTAASGAPATQANPPPEPETPEEKGFWSSAGGWVHGALDVAGFIPGLGGVPDLLNAGIYALEGNYVAAGISAAAAVPIAGDIGKGAIMAGKAATKVGTHAAKESVEHGVGKTIQEAAEHRAEQEVATITDGAKIKPRKLSLREKYLGRTPGKTSRTGKKVQKRMREEGTLRENPLTGETEFKASNEKWYSIEEADMAHKTDAVTWWNNVGRQYGAKSPEVRKWMLEPKNYVLDHSSLNRSAGAKLRERYLPPLE